ncbi:MULTISPECIES: DNA double-strand break repair protein Mre11 [unclassified Stygiolobus]|uniref:DNA double-strand break repair protein Mre11 n=1 Tax=unclassified Stygiolobus TaxID=2824672 RepID=UPI00307E9270
MRILHVSDTHLGKRQYDKDFREEDIYDTFRQIIDIGIKERVDAIIHTGDFFDKNEPPNKAILVALRELKRLKEKEIPFIAIAGDHDSPKRGSSIFPQRILEEEGLLILLDHQKNYYKLNDVEIFGISHVPLTGAKALKEKLEKMKPSSRKSILMLHQGVNPLLPYQYSYQLEISDLPKGFGIITLGHFHDRIKHVLDGGTLVEVAGSPDIISVAELEGYQKNKKGVTIIDYSTNEPSIHYINTDIRPQLEVTINTNNLEKEVESLIIRLTSLINGNTKKPILHITLEGTPRKKNEIVNKLRDLSKVSEYYRIAKDNTSYIDETKNNPKVSPTSSLDEMIMDYLVKVARYTESNAKLVLSILKEKNEDEVYKLLRKFAGLD